MFGQDFWVDTAIKEIPDGAKAVFSDVRFPNEADAIKKLNGQVWRVNRLGVGPANDHASEHALNDYLFDEVLENSTTVNGLQFKVDTLLRNL